MEVGHYCRICGKSRPNERFSGGGHKIHVCRECAKMPRAAREVLEREDEIVGFMLQSHISKKNVARLNALLESTDTRLRALASIVLRVAAVKPHKRRRLKFLRENHPALLRELVVAGLIPDDYPDQSTEVECGYPFDGVVGDSEEEPF